MPLLICCEPIYVSAVFCQAVAHLSLISYDITKRSLPCFRWKLFLQKCWIIMWTAEIHRSERKRVLYAQSCKRSRKHAIWRNRRIYSLSKRENTGSVLRQGRGKPSACKAACKAWVLYQVCYRRFWSISGKKSCNFAISMIRCKRKNTNRYIFRLFQKSICRHTYCANKLISRTILRLNFLFPRCRRSP